MTVMQLKESGAIYIENILNGMSDFGYQIKQYTKEQALHVLKKERLSHGGSGVFADFYYFRLDKGAKQKVRTVLTEQEAAYLENLKADDEQIIFPIDDRLLEIIVKLNEEEILFSSIYFTGEKGRRSTWWGNYQKEYVVFTDK